MMTVIKKNIILQTMQYWGSVPYLYLADYELAGKVCRYNFSDNSFCEISAKQISKQKIARGYYTLHKNALIALVATYQGPYLLIENEWYPFKRGEVTIDFSPGSRENRLRIATRDKQILSIGYKKSEYLNFDNWSSEEDVDLGAELFRSQDDPKFYNWYTLPSTEKVDTLPAGTMLKVDRVSTVEEALELERSGVSVIGISLDDTWPFADNRTVSATLIRELCSQLQKAELAIQLSPEALFDPKLMEQINRNRIGYLQFDVNNVDDSLFSKVIDLHHKIVISGIDADYDTDPGWILAPFERFRLLGSRIFYQVELLSGIENAWDFLKNECPADENLLQIEDINRLSLENQLLISLEFMSTNIPEIANRLPALSGLSITLGTPKGDNFPNHAFSWKQVQEFVR